MQCWQVTSVNAPLASLVLGNLKAAWDQKQTVTLQPVSNDETHSTVRQKFAGGAEHWVVLFQAQDDGFAPSLPVVTPSDPASVHWTATKPCAQVVQRLVALASRSIGALEASYLPSAHPMYMDTTSQHCCYIQLCTATLEFVLAASNRELLGWCWKALCQQDFSLQCLPCAPFGQNCPAINSIVDDITERLCELTRRDASLH